MAITSADMMRLNVSINGDNVPGLINSSISSTNCFSADTYALTFAMGQASPDIAFWSSVSSALIEVTAVTTSSYGSICETLITGMADAIHVDPVKGIVGVEGRDRSSSLVDSYRQQDFVNQTASEIVATISQYHGLVPVVSPTSLNVGRYYSDGYTKLSLGQFSRLRSDWDLVVELARQNNFDVFVQNQFMYFQPSNGLGTTPIPVSLRDLQSVRITRNLNIPADIAATVQSWNSQNMAAYTSNGAGDAMAIDQKNSGSGIPFLFSGSNYTPQQVTASAEQYSAELSRLGTVINIEMPWDLTFTPRALCLLLDTGSAFDTLYQIDTVERHYSSTSGSKQLVRGFQT